MELTAGILSFGWDGKSEGDLFEGLIHDQPGSAGEWSGRFGLTTAITGSSRCGTVFATSLESSLTGNFENKKDDIPCGFFPPCIVVGCTLGGVMTRPEDFALERWKLDGGKTECLEALLWCDMFINRSRCRSAGRGREWRLGVSPSCFSFQCLLSDLRHL